MEKHDYYNIMKKKYGSYNGLDVNLKIIGKMYAEGYYSGYETLFSYLDLRPNRILLSSVHEIIEILDPK